MSTREKSKGGSGKLPSYEEFKNRIQNLEAEMRNVDSHSDFDWLLADVQQWVNSWPPILDDNGSL